jgi:hypothetical protein
VFRSEKQEPSWIDYSQGPAPIFENGRLLFLPARLKNWALYGKIVDLGLEIQPLDRQLTVTGIKGGATSQLMPSVNLVVRRTAKRQSSGSSGSTQPGPRVRDLIMPEIDASCRLAVDVDARKMAKASSVDLAVTRADVAFPDLPANAFAEPAKFLWRSRLPARSGLVELPVKDLLEVGKHQIAALALDGDGEPVGYLSEPRTFIVSPSGR